MAKYTLIKKYKEENYKYYYHVIPSEADTFYICIDTIKKLLLFSKTADFLEVAGIIELREDQLLKEIPDIDFSSIVITTIQAYKALKTNNFPESISRES